MIRLGVLILSLVSLVCLADPPRSGTSHAPPGTDPELVSLFDDAAHVRDLVTTDAVRAWLDEVASLKPVEARTIFYRLGDDPVAYTGDEIEKLGEEAPDDLKSMEFTTERYYSTFYGSPIAYVRALDLASKAGLGSFDAKHVCDLGYGEITHLRMLAACGAEAVGIEVQPILQKLYSQAGDQGAVTGTGGKTGSVRLVHGYWPGGEGVGELVGADYDLFMSRNTLKRGYVNPVFAVPDRNRVKLGVEDDVFLRSIHDVLKPGGLAMIYNIGLGEAGEGDAYVAMNDVHDPFTGEQWEAAGFELVAFDADDSEAARAVGKALGWDQGERGMDLGELFGRYTIARRVD